MLKKLLVTAAAAAAVSVPLAGAAWADPGDPSGNGIGQGGMPQQIDDISHSLGLPDPTPNGPNPPGQVQKRLIRVAFPDGSTPEAYGSYLDTLLPGVYPDKTPTGMGVKASGPGCNQGHTAADLGQAGNCPR